MSFRKLFITVLATSTLCICHADEIGSQAVAKILTKDVVQSATFSLKMQLNFVKARGKKARFDSRQVKCLGRADYSMAAKALQKEISQKLSDAEQKEVADFLASTVYKKDTAAKMELAKKVFESKGKVDKEKFVKKSLSENEHVKVKAFAASQAGQKINTLMRDKSKRIFGPALEKSAKDCGMKI